jgi:predicted metalloenzyme YecM
MINNDTFPLISKELLQVLEDTFPKKDYYPETTLEHVMFYSGQRNLINFLNHQYDLQNENVLNTKLK